MRFIISPIKGLDVKSKRGRPLFGSAGRVNVSKGQFFALTGTLWRAAQPPCYFHEIHLDDGGFWRLDIPRKVDHLIGRPVHVEGQHWDFALIDVDRIWPVGDPRPVFWWERVAAWWRWMRQGRA